LMEHKCCLACLAALYYDTGMNTLTVRLPDELVRRIEQESLARHLSKSDIIRERLAAMPPRPQDHPLADILAEIDRSRSSGRKRDGARHKTRLPEIIPAHDRAAKRH